MQNRGNGHDNRQTSLVFHLFPRLVKEKQIIAESAANDTQSLVDLFFAETAISSSERTDGKVNWVDELT